MKVVLEPVGEELDCAPGETVLDAAFRAGLNLVHGCREGQCSACKCFLLEGEVSLKPFSSFALSESEEANGYTLMCRAMPQSDAVIELLHFDPDALRLAHPIRDCEATVTAIEELTPEILSLRLALDPGEEFGFLPGQYIDVHVPGGGARRSFSLANLPGEGALELIVRRYPGGRLSGMLGKTVVPGTRLAFTGPYGTLRLRDSQAPILLVAGGSGMAPVLGLLRQLAAERCPRPVRFYFGAREQSGLFLQAEIEALGAQLPDFEFIPVTGRFVHELVDEQWQLDGPDVYTCGPPPMIEALEQVLAARGVDGERVFADRFTTAAEALVGGAGNAQPAPPLKTVGEVPPAPADEREFSWYEPARARRTIYEDVTVDTQPSVHRHLTRGWPLYFNDGRATWDDGSTALRAGDWFAFRDPGELWERNFYQRGARIERTLEQTMRVAVRDGLLAELAPAWRESLRKWLQLPAFIEHGLWFALATAGRECLSDTVSTCVCLQAAMKQRSAQAIVLQAMDLEPVLGALDIGAARRTWLEHPAWQPARAYVERLAATRDWGEVIVAANLCFEPAVGALLRRELGLRAAAVAGDTVTPALAAAASEEWEWAEAWSAELVRFLVADAEFGAGNRAVIARWIEDWWPAALEARAAIAALMGVEAVEPAAPVLAVEAVAVAGATELRAASRPAAPREETSSNGAAATHGSWVGIVMAKSAEGDAVAAILARREGIEVLEQPAFWEIRARERMLIPYEEVSASLGYEIDAYSIQHEMSTHYGRLIAGDDALMLFADPSEAMEHLLA